jgi:hypothetical protein
MQKQGTEGYCPSSQWCKKLFNGRGDEVPVPLSHAMKGGELPSLPESSSLAEEKRLRGKQSWQKRKIGNGYICF